MKLDYDRIQWLGSVLVVLNIRVLLLQCFLASSSVTILQKILNKSIHSYTLCWCKNTFTVLLFIVSDEFPDLINLQSTDIELPQAALLWRMLEAERPC
jgi:hypothetical protein